MMGRAKRYRLRFSFWLNILDPDEEVVADQIELLKNERAFSKVCRDGIMLMSDLRKGSSDLLVKLFDWLRPPLELYHELLAGETTMLYHMFPDIASNPPPPPVSPEKIKDMQKKIDELQDRVNSLTDMVIKQQSPGAVDMSVKMAGQGPKPLAVKSVTAPVYDDSDDKDLLVVRKDETAGYQSGINFVKSAFALNGMSYDEPTH